jgi:hypothetical protein
MFNKILLIIIALLLLFIAGQNALNIIGIDQKYEYMITSIPDSTFSSKIDNYGQSGWELVSARRASTGDYTNSVFCYEIIFKRKINLW